MNPTIPQSEIDLEYEKDPASAAAEYGAEFRSDIESFISIEAVRACIVPDCRERAPVRQWRYYAFVDPSGGSNDSMTLAVSHKEGATVVLDAIREIRPQFSPEATVEAFAGLLKTYRITTVHGDAMPANGQESGFADMRINYEAFRKNAIELYRRYCRCQ